MHAHILLRLGGCDDFICRKTSWINRLGSTTSDGWLKRIFENGDFACTERREYYCLRKEITAESLSPVPRGRDDEETVRPSMRLQWTPGCCGARTRKLVVPTGRPGTYSRANYPEAIAAFSTCIRKAAWTSASRGGPTRFQCLLIPTSTASTPGHGVSSPRWPNRLVSCHRAAIPSPTIPVLRVSTTANTSRAPEAYNSRLRK